jgi:amino acid permease
LQKSGKLAHVPYSKISLHFHEDRGILRENGSNSSNFSSNLYIILMAIELIAISLIGCILTSSASSNLIDLIGLICLVSLIGHILLAEEYLPSLVAGGTYTDYSEGNKWHGSCHFFGVCGCSFYHRHRELKTHDSGFVVARASDAPMPVHC